MQALTWIVQPHAIDPVLRAEAFEMLRADYHRRTDTDDAIHACFWLSSPNSGEAFLRSVLADNPDRHSQMLACWELAVMFNTEATRVQAESYFERIISQYGDVPINKDFPESTMADAAQTALYQLRHLGIGQPAPDIDGADVDGKEFKLSDYHGKVVALIFWGRWCVPCWEGIPHERELAEKLKNQPFALLGVNSDSKERCQAALNEGNSTWPNWWDGGDSQGPIAKRWNGSGWPASYVFDAKGVIRYKDVFGAELDAAIDGLLKESKAAAQTPVPTVLNSGAVAPQ